MLLGENDPEILLPGGTLRERVMLWSNNIAVKKWEELEPGLRFADAGVTV